MLSAFQRERVEYVIFGAVALNLQGLARATEDLDRERLRQRFGFEEE